MSFNIQVVSVDILLKKIGGDDKESSNEETKQQQQQQQGSKKKGKKGKGASEKLDNNWYVEGRRECECWLRCSWNKGSTIEKRISDNWKGYSRQWRNVHPQTDDSDVVEFKSDRFWFKEDVSFGEEGLTDRLITDIGNCGGLKLSVYGGKKPVVIENTSNSLGESEDDVSDDSESLGVLLASGRLDLDFLLQGKNFYETLDLNVNDPLIQSMQLQIHVVPDDDFVDFVTGGRILRWNKCVLNAVPHCMVRDLLHSVSDFENDGESKYVDDDDGKNGEGKIGSSSSSKTKMSEEDIVELEELIKQVNPRVDVSIEIEILGERYPFSTKNSLDLEFDRSILDFKSINEETDLGMVFISSDSCKKLCCCSDNDDTITNLQDVPLEMTELRDGDGFDFSNLKLGNGKNGNKKKDNNKKKKQEMKSKDAAVEDADDESKQDEFAPTKSIQLNLNLSSFISKKGATELICRSFPDDFVECSFICNPSIVPNHNALPKETLQVEDVASTSRISKFDDFGKLVRQSAAKHELLKQVYEIRKTNTISPEELENVRVLVIQAMEEDRELQEAIISSNDILGLCSDLYIRLLSEDATLGKLDESLVVTENEKLNNCLTRLNKIAEEAEFVKDVVRANETWLKILNLSSTKKELLGYAKFNMRHGKRTKAIELLKTCCSLNKEKKQIEINEEEKQQQQQQHVFSCYRFENDWLDDPYFLLSLCVFEEREGEKQEQLLQEDEDEEEKETFGSKIKFGIENVAENDEDRNLYCNNLRLFAAFALEYNLKDVSKQAIIDANALEKVPAIDDTFIKKEVLRAKYKLLENKPQAALDILCNCREESEIVCSLNISETLNAQVDYLIGCITEQIYCCVTNGNDNGDDDDNNNTNHHSDPKFKKGISNAKKAYSSALGIINGISNLSIAEKQLRLKTTYKLAFLSMLGKDYRRGRIAFRNAIQLEPVIGNLAWAWVGLGVTNIMLGDLDGADAALKQAVILDDSNPDAWGQIACLQIALDNLKEAMIALDLALENGLSSEPILRRILQVVETTTSQETDIAKNIKIASKQRLDYSSSFRTKETKT